MVDTVIIGGRKVKLKQLESYTVRVTMMKKCPMCGSERIHRNDVGKMTCFDCHYVWRKTDKKKGFRLNTKEW